MGKIAAVIKILGSKHYVEVEMKYSYLFIILCLNHLELKVYLYLPQ